MSHVMFSSQCFFVFEAESWLYLRKRHRFAGGLTASCQGTPKEPHLDRKLEVWQTWRLRTQSQNRPACYGPISIPSAGDTLSPAEGDLSPSALPHFSLKAMGWEWAQEEGRLELEEGWRCRGECTSRERFWEHVQVWTK